MHDIYFIDTPWRLVNAYEARHTFNASDNTLVIVETKNLLNTNQVNKILNKDDWTNIIYIPNNQKSNYLNFAFSIKRLNTKKYNNLFIGWSWFDQLIFANLNFVDAYIVDDGLSTLTFYKNIRNRVHNYHQFFYKKLRFLFIGFKVYSIKKINFFTSFKLSNINGHKIIKHNFDVLRRTLTGFKKLDIVYIVGQAMVEKGMVSESVYISSINSICSNYKDKKIIYIMHRDEYLIGKCIDLIKSENFIVSNIGEPIENHFLNNRIIPSTVVGFFSSSLVNLDNLFGDRINCYFVELSSSDLINGYKEVLVNNKNYFMGTGVKKLL